MCYDDAYDDVDVDDSYKEGFKEFAFSAGIVTKEQDDDDLIDWDDILDEHRHDYHDYLDRQRPDCWTDYVTRQDLM